MVCGPEPVSWLQHVNVAGAFRPEVAWDHTITRLAYGWVATKTRRFARYGLVAHCGERLPPSGIAKSASFLGLGTNVRQADGGPFFALFEHR